MPATEVLRAPFKQNTKPQELLEITKTQPAVGSVFSGFVVNEPNTLRAFVDWDSVEAHKAFKASEVFPPFFERFNKIVAGDFTLWHVEFKPSLEAQHKAQSAAITEVVTFYFAGKPTPDFEKKILGYREVIARQAGYVDMAVGTTYEEVQFNGVAGNAVVVQIGWSSEQSRDNLLKAEEQGMTVLGLNLEEEEPQGYQRELVSLQPLAA